MTARHGRAKTWIGSLVGGRRVQGQVERVPYRAHRRVLLGGHPSDQGELLVVEVVVCRPAIAGEGRCGRGTKRRLLAPQGVDDGPTLLLADRHEDLVTRRSPEHPGEGDKGQPGRDRPGDGAAGARPAPGRLLQRPTSHTSAAVASTKATETYPLRLKKAMSSFDRSLGRRRACSYARSAAIKVTPKA